ncbi:alpha-L-fucosidase [Arthrobacter sp. A2-55]|uniref:alpha-L-fucosidase n=1 Tax=Arthrobacter sp. A2-55 TaxID=2897337 RepID=UPI0021CD8866|nr:alpha-L-fucosidase [Arthrobacter sp. A2-55]MCU6480283.1 alpha-L-fucosidase [Arthrobacter sp. A2-55]
MASMVPTAAQLRWQELGLGVFVHFGVNTFSGLEWSDGTLPGASFDPSGFDADNWVAAAQAAGARYLVLTAKHHDGFCLWPTETTGYSVAASPWRDGRGDMVLEVSRACARAGMGFGLYLSPWDRNAACYGDPEEYDDFYLRQLTELCTGYGPLMELWFDGAGSDGRSYDWDRIAAVVRQHQPEAMIFNMGHPTIRWVGNEDGLAGDPVQYVVAHTDNDQYTDAATGLGSPAYLPPECDVSIRRGWFWNAGDEAKSVEHLLAIFYRSVGMGANLLLNLAPDRRGLIPEADRRTVDAWRAELDRRLSGRVEAVVEHDGGGATLTLPERVEFTHVELVEELAGGQHITRHAVSVDGREVAAGRTVGIRRIHQVEPTSGGRLRVDFSGAGARLASACVYMGDPGAAVPRLPEGYTAPTAAPEGGAEPEGTAEPGAEPEGGIG